jgi:hypothetical protein
LIGPEFQRAHFVTDLFVEELNDSNDRRLTHDLIFYSAELRGYLMAPEGAITNYADVPRAFWSLFPPDGPWKREATLHDCGYRRTLKTLMGQPITLVKPLADNLFREAMSVNPRIGDKTREIMYRSVRRFGGRPYGGLGTLGSDKGTNGNS